ncbi:hypothetical protein [Quadrisphaera setariae]|uniref:Uncharacterized protein n=1 Tax=Quadrisphaera setariae TaxID=2593304 RepID=A0A5C8ZKM2_9ACTN|nr:hypothetical protein [Quadrisphaera setariae]TXR57729.1 hypothetical protein FMM08_00165 [Quadrisphaera setariae]
MSSPFFSWTTDGQSRDLPFHGRVLIRDEVTDDALVNAFAAILRDRGVEPPGAGGGLPRGGVTELVDDAVRAGRPDAGALASVATQVARRSVGLGAETP